MAGNQEPASKRSNVEMEPDSPIGTLRNLRAMFEEYLGPVNERLCSIEEIAEQSSKKLDVWANKVDQLERKADIKDAQVDSLKQENKLLREKVAHLESQSRRENLQFKGVAEAKNENCELKVTEIARSVGIVLDDRSIVRVHRLGKFHSDRQRPIIVKFHHFKDRELVFSKKQEIKNKCNVRVVEDFPQEIEARRRMLYPILDAAYNYRNPDEPEFRYRAKIVVDKLIVNGSMYTIDTLSRLPDPLKPETIFTPVNGKTVAFFTSASPLSNHHLSPFVCNGVEYNCMEQYIMNKKALHFSDTATATKVMSTSNPVEQKGFGKQITDFNKEKWQRAVPDIAMQGLRAKFGQNQHCRDFLLATHDKVIIEASDDSFWGVGMSLKHKDLWNITKWGNNLLGKCLMEIRGEY